MNNWYKKAHGIDRIYVQIKDEDGNKLYKFQYRLSPPQQISAKDKMQAIQKIKSKHNGQLPDLLDIKVRARLLEIRKGQKTGKWVFDGGHVWENWIKPKWR